ncbi:GAF domain-containing protein [Phototrophicus methaneseepsis]|uniref:Oxygen sensor histidine kinase NreB n=1 Tax=Phototrophicus methaneseepsis TaxID=2710758 RepID=A0A7S8IGN9_9CHLR|nr:GAF domain-containing protein [Phototrophicus methaneseepsis]QPC84897.1 GAF domain-containing protein [Phototrophicus methaneseepsis]
MTEILHQLNDIAHAVLTAAEASDVEDTLQQIASVGRDLVKCRYAALGVPDGSGSLRYFMTDGMDAATIAHIGHLPHGHGLIGEIMRQRQTLMLEDMSTHPSSVGFPQHHPEMVTFLGVPVILGQQMFGMMYLCDRIDGMPFDSNDRMLIETLAGYAALTIANVEMSTQHQRLKLLEQRETIGMELHDGIIQSLYGLGMQVEIMRQRDTIEGSELDTVIDGLNDTIEDIRSYIMKLRATEKRQTIRQRIEHIKKRLLVPETVDVIINAPDTVPPFPFNVFESIGLIINEALSNAVRHAQATSIYIETQETDDTFIIIIKDNGIGFAPQDVGTNSGSTGLGLRNMRYRARLYGGNIDVDTIAGQGTTVTVTIPLQI